MAKSNLILEKSWADMFQNLPDEKAGQLIKAAFSCHEGAEPEFDDPVLSAVFAMIGKSIRENAEKYEKKCEQNARNREGSNEKEKETERPLTTVDDRERSEPKEKEKDKREIENGKGKAKEKAKALAFGEYGNVRMSASEYDKLVADFGQADTDEAVKYLDEYIAEKGYKSKSHYLAMRRWVFEAVKERKQKPAAPPGRKANKFVNFDRNMDNDALMAQIIGRAEWRIV